MCKVKFPLYVVFFGSIDFKINIRKYKILPMFCVFNKVCYFTIGNAENVFKSSKILLKLCSNWFKR